MLPNIDRVLKQTNLTLSLFEQRYGGGYTAILAPVLDTAAWVEDQLTGADIPAVEMQVYLGSDAGRRFPAGYADTPVGALEKLDVVLGQVPDVDIEDWWDAVIAAYDSMREAERNFRGDYFISTAFDAGALKSVS